MRAGPRYSSADLRTEAGRHLTRADSFQAAGQRRHASHHRAIANLLAVTAHTIDNPPEPE